MSYESLRNEAMNLVSSDLISALKKFKELRDMHPDIAIAWEDVGNAQMQLELNSRGHTLKDSLVYFEKAATLDSANEHINQSYATCRKHQVTKRFDGNIEHCTLPFPIFPNNQSAEYMETMVDNAFVIKNAIPAKMLEFISINYLNQHHSHIEAEYIAPDKEFQINKTAVPRRMLMHEALRLLEQNDQTYVMWNMRFNEHKELMRKTGLLDKIPVDEYWIDNIIPTDELRDELLLKTHWYQMVIGSRDSGMFNHFDGFQNSGWHLHIKGSKRWHICHPDNTINIKKYTSDGVGEVNCYYPNYESHPDFRKVIAYLGEFTTGDILYYPGRFWHQTHNVQDVNITLTNSAVNKGNVKNIVLAMKSCCSIGKPYVFSKDLCKALESVYEYWNEQYGINCNEIG